MRKSYSVGTNTDILLSPSLTPRSPTQRTIFKSSHCRQQCGEDPKFAKKHLRFFFFFKTWHIYRKNWSWSRPLALPAHKSPNLVSGAGGVGQVEHDGGVGGLEADGAGGRVDERCVSICHDAVAWRRRKPESATSSAHWDQVSIDVIEWCIYSWGVCVCFSLIPTLRHKLCPFHNIYFIVQVWLLVSNQAKHTNKIKCDV